MVNNYLSFETVERTENFERVKNHINLNVQMSQKLINMRTWTTEHTQIPSNFLTCLSS